MQPLILALLLTAAPQTQATVTLWVDGTSTVRNFTCQVPTFSPTVALTRVEKEPPVPGLAWRLSALSLELPVTRIDCGDKTMDAHLRTALKATEHPTIAFQVTGHQLHAPAGGPMTVTVDGELNLAGQTHPLKLTGELAPEGEALRAKGKVEVKMTKWGVTPPSLMLGVIRVGETAVVRFELSVRELAPAAAAEPPTP
jgi:polyisoprenoid-binding protein YceI